MNSRLVASTHVNESGYSASHVDVARFEEMFKSLLAQVEEQQREIDALRGRLEVRASTERVSDRGAPRNQLFDFDGDSHLLDLPEIVKSRVAEYVRHVHREYEQQCEVRVARAVAERLNRVTHEHVRASIDREVRRVIRSAAFDPVHPMHTMICDYVRRVGATGSDSQPRERPSPSPPVDAVPPPNMDSLDELRRSLDDEVANLVRKLRS